MVVVVALALLLALGFAFCVCNFYWFVSSCLTMIYWESCQVLKGEHWAEWMVVSLNPHQAPLFSLRTDLRLSLGTIMETVSCHRCCPFPHLHILKPGSSPVAGTLSHLPVYTHTPCPTPHIPLLEVEVYLGERICNICPSEHDVTFLVPLTFLQVSYFCLSLWHH